MQKEIIIFSSTKVLCNILSKNNFVNYFMSLLKNGVKIKILIDKKDSILQNHTSAINDTSHQNKIQLMHTNKMIDFKEGAIIADDKHLLQIKYNVNNQLVGFYSLEEHDILLQEILFEKHWNDVKSLKVINSN